MKQPRTSNYRNPFAVITRVVKILQFDFNLGHEFKIVKKETLKIHESIENCDAIMQQHQKKTKPPHTDNIKSHKPNCSHNYNSGS